MAHSLARACFEPSWALFVATHVRVCRLAFLLSGQAVTHMLTTKSLVFTVKTVLALVAGVPIVHPNWAQAIIERPTLKDPLPVKKK